MENIRLEELNKNIENHLIDMKDPVWGNTDCYSERAVEAVAKIVTDVFGYALVETGLSDCKDITFTEKHSQEERQEILNEKNNLQSLKEEAARRISLILLSGREKYDRDFIHS
jgi:hypothetical protein